MGLGATIGAVVFAVIGERLYRKNPRLLPLLCGAGVLVGILPMLPVLNYPLFDPEGMQQLLLNLGAFVGGFLVSVPSANVKAILMNVNRPEHRGSVFAVFNITDNLGQGFGPAIGGLLVPLGYQFTMNFALFWWLPCGLIFFMVARYIVADRDRLQQLLLSRATRMQETEVQI